MPLIRLPTTILALQLLVGSALLWSGTAVHPQSAPQPPVKPLPSLPSHPLWAELTAAQQQALAPLAQQWPGMTESHKRKWLAVSKNFTQLSAEEQNTVQSRMREWAALTPQQRAAARLNYADAQQLLLEDKKAKWEAYQALSPEAKQKLAAQQSKPPIMGAATAIKPVAPQKLAAPPAASGNKALPRIASDQAAPITLLPNSQLGPNTAVNSNAPAGTPAETTLPAQ